MKRMKKMSVVLFLSVLLFCVNFMPKVYGKYQHSVKDKDAFVIEFPIQNISAVVAETLAGKFGNILNAEEKYATLLNQIETGGSLAGWGIIGRPDTYVGNVDGATDNDSKVIRELFGLEEDEDLMYGKDPVTVIIARQKLDGDDTTGEQEGDSIDSNGASTAKVGCEMVIYTTSATIDPDKQTTIEVYAMVFSKYGSGDWLQVGQYKGKADTNRYNGLIEGWLGGDYNSFNISTWKSTETYYNVEMEKIAEGATLATLVQNEYRAQANLAAMKTGTDLPYTDFT